MVAQDGPDPSDASGMTPAPPTKQLGEGDRKAPATPGSRNSLEKKIMEVVQEALQPVQQHNASLMTLVAALQTQRVMPCRSWFRTPHT